MKSNCPSKTPTQSATSGALLAGDTGRGALRRSGTSAACRKTVFVATKLVAVAGIGISRLAVAVRSAAVEDGHGGGGGCGDGEVFDGGGRYGSIGARSGDHTEIHVRRDDEGRQPDRRDPGSAR